MSPKEKAKYLVDSFSLKSLNHDMAKETSITYCDEILDLIEKEFQGWLDTDITNYWKNVKTEIFKL